MAPQSRVRRVFAFQCVVANKLERQFVVMDQHLRRQGKGRFEQRIILITRCYESVL